VAAPGAYVPSARSGARRAKRMASVARREQAPPCNAPREHSADSPLPAPSESIDFAEIAAYPLVMPGPRDGVRQQVLSTAKRLALTLDVILDVSSVSMMKNMVARGDAAAVMPYGNVIDEIARGRIVGRRIAKPPLKRTLYLVRPVRRAPFIDEGGVLDLLALVSRQYVSILGPLATALPALRDGALRAALAAHG
jgi:hypothetical protein